MDFDRHAEEGSVDLFAQSIMKAGESFLANPMAAPFIPNWNRVHSAIPDISEQMRDAVTRDNREN
jgi:glucosyl-3-phosphoglycerate synthase